MFNEIILIGKLVNPPIVKETGNGIQLVTIVLDIERPYRNYLGVHEHDFIQCVLWKGLGQKVMDCCEVGNIIGVKGRLQSHTFETNDLHSLTIMEVKVEHIEFMDHYFVKK